MAAQQAPLVSKHSESQFFHRLESLAQGSTDTDLKNLCNATQRLMENAGTISKQVNRFLPQFTLHDTVHLWNVLSFMEALAGGAESIQQLGAGDCAMAIWAAFIHDLGMVLEAQELALLDEADEFDVGIASELALPVAPPSDERAHAWRAHRDGHPHWSTIRKDPHSKADRMRLGVIRADFIRASHARDDALTGHCRIADWLRLLAQSDKLLDEALETFSLADRIVRVAVSHNQDIGWLPRQLGQLGVSPVHAESMGGTLGTIHWTWIGWLLRLADVMDCDKSRTPKILFEHSGITDPRSKTEWQKHLAIRERPQWNADSDQQTLLYTCQKSPSPIVEKALHQIVGWMNAEIDKVHTARLDAQHNDLPALRLPSRARVEIKQREGGYLYHDMEFRLDRDAVVELLMGESLYGGPELALRELVQNALDAVHLRDQRNKLAAQLRRSGSTERQRQPHQPWEEDEVPGVEVTWGFDEHKTLSDGRKGCSFIRVRDNGVGMTVGTMRRFLTEIGKSYYKSDDFRAEQRLMRLNGILCTAISQFGIGFLSVFMLADEVIIHTRPLGVVPGQEAPPTDAVLQESARFPFRAEIHGPHGLLAFYPDQSRETQQPGTAVTVWLKERFILPEWDAELFKNRLRKEFYERDLRSEDNAKLERQRKQLKPLEQLLDAAFEIGRFIVWPLYPVTLSDSSKRDVVEINGEFHHRVLVPLDREKLRAKAEEWGHHIPEIEQTDWRVCEWIDEYSTPTGIEGTGTRIRLIASHPESQPTGTTYFKPADWAALSEYLPSGKPRLLLGNYSESQLPEPMNRYQCLVNGVRIVPGFVPKKDDRDCKLMTILNRLAILPGAGSWVWIDLRGAAMPRLRADRSEPTKTQPSDTDLLDFWNRWNEQWTEPVPHWLFGQFNCLQFWKPENTPVPQVIRLGLRGVSAAKLAAFVSSRAAILHSIYRRLPGDVRLLVSRETAPNLNLDRALNRDLNRDVDAELVFARAFDLSRGFDHMHPDDLERNRPHFIAIKNALSDGSNRRRVAITAIMQSHLAQEAIAAQLAESHPALGLNRVKITLDSIDLVGPMHISLRQSAQSIADWLAPYDLVAPFTVIPMSRLSAQISNWTSRRFQRLYMLPFLLGKHPSSRWRPNGLPTRLESLLLFIPNPEHWEWLFEEHSREEWEQGSASALWDLKTRQVLYADGVHDEASIRQHGLPLLDWLKLPD